MFRTSEKLLIAKYVSLTELMEVKIICTVNISLVDTKFDCSSFTVMKQFLLQNLKKSRIG